LGSGVSVGVGVGVGEGDRRVGDGVTGGCGSVSLAEVVGAELVDDLLGRSEVSCEAVTTGSDVSCFFEPKELASRANRGTRTTSPSTMPSATGTPPPPGRLGGDG
jgi:hypothetical protein